MDIWAAGVILLCILSRTYPFFRAPDDYTALAELVALFGTKAVQDAAGQYGKIFIFFFLEAALLGLRVTITYS